MKRWIIVLCLLAFAGSAGAFSLSGSVAGGQGLPLRYVFAIPTSFDTFYVTIAIPFVNTYQFPNLAEGGYILFAYQDQNNNIMPDLDERRGFYGEDGSLLPEPFALVSDTSGVVITIHPPNTGGFSGTVSYEGSHTGPTYVAAFYTADFGDFPHGAGIVMNSSGVGNYLAQVDSFTTYYAFAFMDLNRNTLPDSDEPFGIYGGATPAPIEVDSTDFPEDVDITLLDPVTSADPDVILPPSSFSLSAYPNPFNSRTRVSFELPQAGLVDLAVYNVLGRQVAHLEGGNLPAGRHERAWDGGDLPSGLYILRLQAGANTVCAKLAVLK